MVDASRSRVSSISRASAAGPCSCSLSDPGPLVTLRRLSTGDRVLFDAEDKAEVEVNGELYVVMRERDVHAVAAERVGDEATGLYL